MPTPMSSHAQRTLERLTESWVVNGAIFSDAARNDAHCPSSNNPNAKFNSSLEFYLGSLQVCHAADALNSYCQSIFGEIIKIDNTAWIAFDSTIKDNRKVSREVMIERLFGHKATDRVIREHLRDVLKAYWPLESEVVTLLRNKFVHQSGHDPKREVEQLINSKSIPWCSICVDAKPGADEVRYLDAEWLDADVQLGQWACAHIRTHIHMMDQNLCFRFKLPRGRWRPRPISRQMGSLSTPRRGFEHAIPPLVTNEKAKLTESPPEMKTPTPTSKTPQEEIDCARAWGSLQTDIGEFVKGYMKESGVDSRGLSGGIVGRPQGHTIKGQERFIEYDIAPDATSDSSKEERICLRLRERNFIPYVTVWSRRAPMRDFITPTLTPELQEYIRDVIDKVITH